MNFFIKNMTLLIFTDIDGTFINNDTFEEGLNTKTISELAQAQHSVVFNTSKTFEEVAYFQKKMYVPTFFKRAVFQPLVAFFIFQECFLILSAMIKCMLCSGPWVFMKGTTQLTI